MFQICIFEEKKSWRRLVNFILELVTYNFSLFIQFYLKSVPIQFPLWFITWYLYKKSYLLLPVPRLYRNLGVIPG